MKEQPKERWWEKEFYETWKNPNGITVLDKPLRDFIKYVESTTRAKCAEEVLSLKKKIQCNQLHIKGKTVGGVFVCNICSIGEGNNQAIEDAAKIILNNEKEC